MGDLGLPLISTPESDVPHDDLAAPVSAKADADYVFHELTRSICPTCRRVIDAKILLKDNKVYMRKRCPDCGPFVALVYGDAEAYLRFAGFNKPGTIPLAFSTTIEHGCPHDCGLCPDHQQHACLGIIEVNSACDMDCPLCFANAEPGFSLTMEEVEADSRRASCVRRAARRWCSSPAASRPSTRRSSTSCGLPRREAFRFVMINTNGKRIASDDRSWHELAEVTTLALFPVRRLRARDLQRSYAASRKSSRKSCARWTGWLRSD